MSPNHSSQKAVLLNMLYIYMKHGTQNSFADKYLECFLTFFFIENLKKKEG
jgi:hypothetical protein